MKLLLLLLVNNLPLIKNHFHLALVWKLHNNIIPCYICHFYFISSSLICFTLFFNLITFSWWVQKCLSDWICGFCQPPDQIFNNCIPNALKSGKNKVICLLELFMPSGAIPCASFCASYIWTWQVICLAKSCVAILASCNFNVNFQTHYFSFALSPYTGGWPILRIVSL